MLVEFASRWSGAFMIDPNIRGSSTAARPYARRVCSPGTKTLRARKQSVGSIIYFLICPSPETITVATWPFRKVSLSDGRRPIGVRRLRVMVRRVALVMRWRVLMLAVVQEWQEVILGRAIHQHVFTMISPTDVGSTDHRSKGIDGFRRRRDPGHPIIREDAGNCIQRGTKILWKNFPWMCYLQKGDNSRVT